MTEKQQKLLYLIKKLELPILEEDAVKRVENLSEEQLNYLIVSYEAVAKAEDNTQEKIKKTNPKLYQKLKNDYHQKVSNINSDYYERLENTLEKSGHIIEKAGLKTHALTKELLHKQEVENHKLDDDHKALYSAISSALVSSTTTGNG